MFFSSMRAFNIGFRDINFGRWLRLFQGVNTTSGHLVGFERSPGGNP